MDKRSKVFQYFGPKLQEALFITLIELINENRRAQGWDEITIDELLARVTNHITELPDYDWMDKTHD